MNDATPTIPCRRLLIGTWDLTAFQVRDGERVERWSIPIGLMTCAEDGTFTFQMKLPGNEILSTWGHVHWLTPHAMVHVVEWLTNDERIGVCTTFTVTVSDSTHLVLVADDGMRFEFER